MENVTEFVFDGCTSDIEVEHNYIHINAVTPTETNSCDSKALWEYRESKALIKSVETHYEALNHPVKRKTMWQNVSMDLESVGIVRTSKNCAEKWKNLLRSYKCCKDNNKKTGRGPTRFMFFEMMDDFLGTKPNNSCAHTIAVGATKNNEVKMFQKPNNDTIIEIEKTSEVLGSASGNSPMIKSKKRKVSGNDEFLQTRTFLEEKKLEERIFENKRKDERYKNRMEWMNRKLELEDRKLKAFEKYFQAQGN